MTQKNRISKLERDHGGVDSGLGPSIHEIGVLFQKAEREHKAAETGLTRA